MYNSKLAIVIGCLLLAVSIALACGPAFSGQLPGDRADALSFLSHEEPPAQLLDDRARTLKATPVNSFEFEVKRLAIRSKDSLKPIEGFQTIALYTAEAAGLSPEQAALVQQMRTARRGRPGVSTRCCLGSKCSALHCRCSRFPPGRHERCGSTIRGDPKAARRRSTLTRDLGFLHARADLCAEG